MGKRCKTHSPSDSESKMEEEPSKKRRPSPPSTTTATSSDSSSGDQLGANQSSTRCTAVAVISPAEQTVGDILEATRSLATSASVFWNGLQEIQRQELFDPNGFLEKTKSPSWNYDWDGKESVTPRSEKSRFIYLVRHGQYHSNADDDKERTLTPLGHIQAEQTGYQLAYHTVPIPRRAKFKSVTSSSMVRALETSVEVLRSGLSMEVAFKMDPMLIEGYPCTPDPVELCNTKKRGCSDGPRIENAFKKYFHRAHHTQMEDSHEIIICHANIIRYFVCRAMQFPPDAWLRIALAHGSITKLEIQHDGFVILRGVNETAHFYGDATITYI